MYLDKFKSNYIIRPIEPIKPIGQKRHNDIRIENKKKSKKSNSFDVYLSQEIKPQIDIRV